MKEYEDEIFSAIIIDENTTFKLSDIQTQYHIENDLLHELIEQGLINFDERSGQNLINLQTLHRLQMALRLYEDLEINLSGVALIIELLEKLDKAQSELQIYRKTL